MVKYYENFDKFKTELGPVLEFISSVGNGNKLEKAIQEKGEHWTNLSNEAIDLLNICLDAKLEVGNTKEGVGNVCKGIEELKEMCIARGKAEGKAEGILSTLLQLVRDGLLSLSVGAQRAGMSEDDFNALLSKQ